MKKLLTIHFLLLFALVSNAQNYNFQWSSGLFDNGLPNGVLLDTVPSLSKGMVESSTGVTIDNNGNTIVTAHFSGNYANFPPFYKVYETSSGHMAIQKRDPDGNILWSKWIAGGNYATVGVTRVVNDVATDSQNNIYICGYINDTTDFDPGAGEALGLAPSTFTGFVAKYDPNGNYQWVYQLTGGSDCNAHDVEIDSNDDVVVYGLYEGTLDFDAGGPAAANSSFLNKDDLFLLKLNPQGQYVWHNAWGSAQTDDPMGLALDDNDNIHIASAFAGALDSDPGPDTNVVVSAGGSSANVNAYVNKFASDGSWLWTSVFNATNTSWIIDLACDGQSVAVVGDFDGTYTVGHSGIATTIPQTSPGNFNITVVKLDAAGQYEWDYQPQELSGPMNSLVYELGYHNGSWLAAFSTNDVMDLDNGAGVDSIGGGNKTEYLVQLAADGTYLNYLPYEMDGSGFVELHEITSKGDDLYIVGHYSNAGLDVNPAPNQNEILPMWFQYTFFLTKLKPDCQPSYDTIAAAECYSYTSPSGNHTWDSTDTYTDTIPNAAGCDSVLTINLTITDCPTPTNLKPKFMQDVSAVVKWQVLCAAPAYEVYYKPVGATTWQKVRQRNGKAQKLLTGLTPDTKYMWRVQSICAPGVTSPLTSAAFFTTLSTACSVPNGLSTTGIRTNKARVNWAAQANVKFYRLRWREVGTTQWNNRNISANRNKFWLTNLTAGTSYEWQIKTICTSDKKNVGTAWTAMQVFTTDVSAKTASLLGADKVHESSAQPLSMFPNPATHHVTVVFESDQIVTSVVVSDMLGKALVSAPAAGASGQLQLDLSGLASGIYLCSLRTADGGQYSQKLVIQR